jgi:hypothetical protein
MSQCAPSTTTTKKKTEEKLAYWKNKWNNKKTQQWTGPW